MTPGVLHLKARFCEHGFMATIVQNPNAERPSLAMYAILGINLGLVPVFATLIANRLLL